MTTIRSSAERAVHARTVLAGLDDVWVATASADGVPHLVPLSSDWDGHDLLVGTLASTPTARNLQVSGRARLATGDARDVVVAEATAEVVPIAEADDALMDRFATGCGWDPRRIEGDWVYVRLTPRRVLVWLNEAEFDGRVVLRDGRWADA